MKNTRTAYSFKIFSVFLIGVVFFLLFPLPGVGHLTPQDNFDGHGRLLLITRLRSGQGTESNNCRGQSQTGDPVNAATGEFTESVTDLSVLGRISIQVRRTYRSQRQHYSSPFGANWFFIYDYKLRKLEDGDLVITFPSGDEMMFAGKKGGYKACCGSNTAVTENADGTYTLKAYGFRSYIFDGEGNLIRMQEPSGDALHFVYSKEKKAVHGPFRYSTKTQTRGVLAVRKRLKEIRDDWGRFVKFSYYDDEKRGGRVKSAAFMAGTEHAVRVTYDYDEKGNLISVTGPPTSQHPGGTTTRYTYSSGHSLPNLTHNLVSITAPKEVAAGKGPYLVNKYDANDRVIEQEYGRGTLYFSYTKKGENRVTTVKDRAGNTRIMTFNHRGNAVRDVIKGRGLRRSDPQKYVFTYEYDEKTGNLTRAVNPSGSVRTHRYDDRGNIIETRYKEKDGPDSPNDVVSRFTFEKRYDRLKTHTDTLGRTTVYDYDYEEAERGDLNGDGITNQTFGQVIRITLPPANPGEKPAVYLYRCNRHAQLISVTNPRGVINRIEYYETGLPGGRVRRRIDDVNGIAASNTMEYDALGNITAVTGPNGKTARFEVDPGGHITRSVTTEPFEDKVDYFYDKNGNLTRIDIENKGPGGAVNPKNPFITFVSEYDLQDNLVAEKIEIGNVDAEAVNAAASSTKDVLVTRMSYDIDDRIQQVIHPGGEIEQLEYDERGLILRRTLAPGTPEQAVTHYTYSIDGYLTQVKDANGNINQFKLDSLNRLRESIDPKGNRLTREYDAGGNLVKLENRGADQKLLSLIEWEYDGLDRLKMEHIHFFGPDGLPLKDGPLTPGDGRVSTAYFYDMVGNLVRETDDNKNSFSYTYDGLDRLVKETDPLGNSITYVFDKAGNLITMQMRDKHPGEKPDVLTTYRYVYDALNRLKKRVDPLGNITGFKYDSRGNMVYRKDANGDGLRIIYDSLSRPIRLEREMRDENGTLIKSLEESYRYYGRERPASVTDHNGNTTRFSYNALGFPDRIQYADGSTLTMTGDGIGGIKERIDPRGIKTTYSYYKNNLLHTSTTGNKKETYTYDGMGRVLSAEMTEHGEKTGSLSWQYDSMGNRVSTAQDGKRVLKRFDGEGNLLELTYPDNISVTRTFDPLRRVTSISRGSRKVSDYTYIGPGRVFRQEFGNNTYLSREYDRALRIIKNVSGFNAVPFDGVEYDYDAVGRRITEKASSDQPGNKHFKYDSAGRLVEARYNVDKNTGAPSKSFSFELDGVGNRISQTVNETKTLFNHDTGGQYRSDPLNRYTHIQGRKREHDTAGNVTVDNRYRYFYDRLNQLVEVQNAHSKKTVARYDYDTMGRRTAKHTAEGTQVYIYDGFQVIAEYNGDGTLDARYIYGEGIDDILQIERGGRTYTYHKDIRGNINCLTDASGKVVETYTYEPFGAVTIRDGEGNIQDKSKVGNPYFFTGRRLDPETGFYYYRFRIYDPVTGRFLQRDPLGYDEGPNLYQYVGGDPLSFNDPMGLGIFRRFYNRYLRPAWREVRAYGIASTHLYSEVIASFMDGRAHDSLQGAVYQCGGRFVGMNSRPTYGHTEAFQGGRKVGRLTARIQAEIIVAYATAGASHWLKGARIFQVCSRGGRIARYIGYKLIDAGLITLGRYLLDENRNCWTAEDFVRRMGMSALISAAFDIVSAFVSQLMGSPNGFFEEMERLAGARPAVCFAAGTLVAAEDGLRAIEEIEVGDNVRAMDPEKDEIKLAEVSAAYERKTNRLYIVEIEGETIETTREHPFWVKGKGWVQAGNLIEGDKIKTLEKGAPAINRITVKTGEYKVYNLKVKDTHNYFVSSFKVLVHNNDDCPTGSDDDMLYRGVPSGTERGNLAERGIVRPRGASTDYLAHVRGDAGPNAATNVTSWTSSRREAERFGDIILEIPRSQVRNRIVPHPAPGLYGHEKETLILGDLFEVKRTYR